MNISTSTNLSLLSLFCLFASSPGYAGDDKTVTVKTSQQTVTLSGFTRARHSMPIASEISGKITHIYADIGQAIPKTGVFACLDKAFVNLDIKSTKNNIARHGIDLQYFSKQVERHQKLIQSKSISRSTLDDLIREKDNAYRKIQSEKINQQKQEETRRRHCIKVPKNWQITQRNIEVGQWVTAGTAIAQADDYSQLLIPLALTAEELSALESKKNKFTIYLPEYKEKIAATIEHISPAFDEKSHKIRVNLLIKDTSKFYRGGIRAELSLEVSDKLNTYFISKQALDERFEEAWLTRKNGEKIRVMLLGHEANGDAKISSSDIKIGDQFIIQQQ